MAGHNIAEPPRTPNYRCDFRIFRDRFEGKIPCVAVGPELIEVQEELPQAEITGLYFHKISDGLIRPVLPQDYFSPFHWANAPTQEDRHIVPVDLPEAPDPVPLDWVNFRDVAQVVSETLLKTEDFVRVQSSACRRHISGLAPDILKMEFWTHMMSPEGLLPDLYTAFNMGARGIGDISQLPGRRAVAAALANRDLNDEKFDSFFDNMMSGFDQDAQGLGQVLKVLFAEILRGGHRFEYTVSDSPHSLSNKSLIEGVPHCLVYGYHRLLPEYQAAVNNRKRQSRLKHRVLQRKRTGRHSRSRSRSESPVSTVESDSERRMAEGVPDLQEIIAHFEAYEITQNETDKYIEPHTPDLMVVKTTVNENEQYTQALLVVEVAGFRKGCLAPLHVYVEDSVEQNLQQTVASLSSNQNSITGLIVFLDGLKLTQICREQGGYTVKETAEVVKWNSANFFRVLQFVENSLH